MPQEYTASETFEGIDYTETPFLNGEYDGCSFSNCNFSGVDISGCLFIECSFINCNLSLAGMVKTSFRDVAFKDCKMLGLLFGDCNEFGLLFSFNNCQLNNCSFYQVKIKKTVFRNCQLQEVDFTSSDMTGAVLDNCDMANATFDRTILEKADFTTSFNYSINPETNYIKKAKFSLNGLPGLLQQYDIIIEH